MFQIQAGPLLCEIGLVDAGADPAELGLAGLQPGESISAQMAMAVESVG